MKDPIIYDVLLDETFKDSKNQIRKCEIGMAAHPPRQEKVILIVGATGAGKTTLINAMVNYMFNVKWEDSLRFKVIRESGDDSQAAQAHSMTKCITSYTVQSQDDCPSPFSLTIIDTPGFGDTGGIERDREITEQLKRFFSNKGSTGIDHVDAVGIVVQSALARLTIGQKYVFDSVLSVFGKDIEENIFLFITFADHQEPPVLAAVKEAKLPFKNFFRFNNSALYSNNANGNDSSIFAKLFWGMGVESMAKFFSGLHSYLQKACN